MALDPAADHGRELAHLETEPAVFPRCHPNGVFIEPEIRSFVARVEPAIDARLGENVNRRANLRVNEHGQPRIEKRVAGGANQSRSRAVKRVCFEIERSGLDGQSLQEEWSGHPEAYKSASAHGYPNLFVCVGPGSPAVLATYPPQIELQVGWIVDLLTHLRDRGITRVEANVDAQDAWCEHVNDVAAGTMFTAPSCNSWYNGQNIEGKPRVFLPYVGGIPKYMGRCNDGWFLVWAGVLTLLANSGGTELQPHAPGVFLFNVFSDAFGDFTAASSNIQALPTVVPGAPSLLPRPGAARRDCIGRCSPVRGCRGSTGPLDLETTRC